MIRSARSVVSPGRRPWSSSAWDRPGAQGLQVDFQLPRDPPGYLPWVWAESASTTSARPTHLLMQPHRALPQVPCAVTHPVITASTTPRVFMGQGRPDPCPRGAPCVTAGIWAARCLLSSQPRALCQGRLGSVLLGATARQTVVSCGSRVVVPAESQASWSQRTAAASARTGMDTSEGLQIAHR